MKNKKIVVIFLIVGLVAIGGFWLKSKHTMSPIGENDSVSQEKGKKVLYWKAPMDPNYISKTPGKSPMGMDLVPVYEGEEQAVGSVKIDPVVVQNMGVKTEVVQKRVLERKVRAVGRVDYDEKKVSYINTKVGGWIEKLYVDHEGQLVEKDSPLLEIYSPELVATQQEYLLALEYYNKLKDSNVKEIGARSKALLEAARKRLEYWDIPEVHIKEIEKFQKVQKALMIHAPSSGVVTHKNVLEGKYVKPGENLYMIADLSTLWVYADIYEYELPWVKVGQDAKMNLSYLPGKNFKGKITYIYPYLDEKTRTAKVRLEFENTHGKLKPAMYADVTINTSPNKAVLAVPKEAVIHSGKRKVIIVNKSKGMFEPRDVNLGSETKDFYEILDGVKEGEKVVTSAQFLIDSESQLNEAIQKMLKADTEMTQTIAAEQGTMDMPDQSMDEKKEMNLDADVKKLMDDIWEEYFYLKEHLAKDSIFGFSQKSKLISEKVKHIMHSGKGKALSKITEDILKSTKDIELKDIVKARQGFLGLSNAMIAYMKNHDLKDSKEKGYQLFYCSTDKNFWVQKDKKIANPYVGAEMSYCGAPEEY